MIRMYLNSLLASEKQISLNPMQQHYLKTVMRKKSGAELLVFNEQDGEWSAILQEKSVLVKKKLREPEERSKKYLAIGCIKQNRLETIVEKATEIGIDTIFLLQTDRSNSREANLNRLKSISIEATEQSGRIRPLVIEKPQQISKFLQSNLKFAFLHPEKPEIEVYLKSKDKSSTIEYNGNQISDNCQRIEEVKSMIETRDKSEIDEIDNIDDESRRRSHQQQDVEIRNQESEANLEMRSHEDEVELNERSYESKVVKESFIGERIRNEASQAGERIASGAKGGAESHGGEGITSGVKGITESHGGEGIASGAKGGAESHGGEGIASGVDQSAGMTSHGGEGIASGVKGSTESHGSEGIASGVKGSTESHGGEGIGQKLQKNIDCMIIGPEGGFSPDELKSLHNLERVSLGKNILRTETASIIAAYLLMSKSHL